MKKVKEHIPVLYNMTWQSYAKASNLYFNGQDIIQSREGVQQGDPMGPLLFSLAIQDLVNSCKSELNTWYLDDGLVAGTPDDVHHDLSKILEASNSLGLAVNASKCEFFVIPKSSDPATGVSAPLNHHTNRILSLIKRDAPGIREMDRSNLILLGAPILEEAVDNILLSKLRI